MDFILPTQEQGNKQWVIKWDAYLTKYITSLKQVKLHINMADNVDNVIDSYMLLVRDRLTIELAQIFKTNRLYEMLKTEIQLIDGQNIIYFLVEFVRGIVETIQETHDGIAPDSYVQEINYRIDIFIKENSPKFIDTCRYLVDGHSYENIVNELMTSAYAEDIIKRTLRFACTAFFDALYRSDKNKYPNPRLEITINEKTNISIVDFPTQNCKVYIPANVKLGDGVFKNIVDCTFIFIGTSFPNVYYGSAQGRSDPSDWVNVFGTILNATAPSGATRFAGCAGYRVLLKQGTTDSSKYDTVMEVKSEQPDPSIAPSIAPYIALQTYASRQQTMFIDYDNRKMDERIQDMITKEIKNIEGNTNWMKKETERLKLKLESHLKISPTDQPCYASSASAREKAEMAEKERPEKGWRDFIPPLSLKTLEQLVSVIFVAILITYILMRFYFQGM